MNSDMSPDRWFVGCMTGTSLDGLDAALVRIVGEQRGMRAERVHHLSHPLPGPLVDAIMPLARGEAVTPLHVLRTARHLGVVHAEAVSRLLAEAAVQREQIDSVVCHGQTVWHAPEDRLSWQLFDPWPIVRTLRLPVCYDLRQADLVAGGQGAPITPAADRVLFAAEDERVLIANLGGICNITVLTDELIGEDICPCNLLMDGIVRKLDPPRRYDEDGKLTETGRVDEALLAAMTRHPWFEQPRPRTAGREQFSAAWIDQLLDGRSITTADACATAAAMIAGTIAEAAVSHAVDRIVLAGGGANNQGLAQRISETAPRGAAVSTSEAFGVPIEAREAMAMAVLGAMSRDGLPITIPQITGASEPGRAGVWALP